MNIIDKFINWKVDTVVKFIVVWIIFSVLLTGFCLWRIHAHRAYCMDKYASMECSTLRGTR